MVIKSLCCTESSCVQEFEGTTDGGKNIVIYYRSGALKIQLDNIEIVKENLFSPENNNFFASLDEIQDRVVSHGIHFPESCTLSGLLNSRIN